MAVESDDLRVCQKAGCLAALNWLVSWSMFFLSVYSGACILYSITSFCLNFEVKQQTTFLRFILASLVCAANDEHEALNEEILHLGKKNVD